MAACCRCGVWPAVDTSVETRWGIMRLGAMLLDYGYSWLSSCASVSDQSLQA